MKVGTRLKRILAIDAERLRITLEYSDRLRGTVELAFLFEQPRRKRLVSEILRGQLFDRCFIESGALAWPNGYELCPDAIRTWITAQRRHRAA